MSQNEDKIFMRHITIIMLILAVFTVAIIFLGAYLGKKNSPTGNPSKQALAESNLQSPAAVHSGNEAPVIAAPVATAPIANTDSDAGEIPAVDIDGAAIYQTACLACHSSGVAGAPKLVAADWTNRLPQGEDTLVDHAINGLNAMPPKGGQMQLSDAEVRAAVLHMISQVQ
ncbi:MAG: c-type cytochrome [Xanthomonadales bacterium]|nr:c-type cytochrome [Xanthomonadales bacterium]